MQSENSGPTLGDLVTLVRGNTYKSALLGQPGPVLLGLASIQRDGGFRADSLKTYGGESAEKLLLRPGNIYVSLKDVTQSGDLLGAVARVPHSVPLGRVTQDTVKLEFDVRRYPADLLYWVLRAPEYRAYCRERAIGTTNLSLSRDDFLAFRLPSATAQRHSLVELLEAIERRIDILRQTNATLQSIVQTLFKSWFIDFDPVRAKAEGREPEGMDAGTAALFNGVEPASFGGWQRIPVGQLVSDGVLLVGDGYRAKNAELGLPGVSFVRAGDLLNGRITPTQDFLSLPSAQKAGAKMAKAGDTVFTSKGTIGRFAYVGDEAVSAVYSPQVCFWRSLKRDVLAPAFLHFWMRSPLFSVQVDKVRGQAAIMDFVSLSDQRRMFLDLPPYSLQKRFAEFAAPVLAKIDGNRKTERLLAELRDTLLPRLISGKLHLPETEAQLNEAYA